MIRTYPLVGMHFRPPAKAIVAKAPMGLALRLVPDRANPYDENAVAVFTAAGALAGMTTAQLEAMGQEATGMGYDSSGLIEGMDGKGEGVWQLGFLAAKMPKGYPEGTRLNAELAGRIAPEGIAARLGFDAQGRAEVQVAEEDLEQGLEVDQRR